MSKRFNCTNCSYGTNYKPAFENHKCQTTTLLDPSSSAATTTSPRTSATSSGPTASSALSPRQVISPRTSASSPETSPRSANNPKWSNCYNCNFSSDIKAVFYEHIAACNSRKCKKCDFISSDRAVFDAHKKSHRNSASELTWLNAKGTFRFPAHMSPENIAHSFNKETYDPYVSVKVDGIFHAVKRDDYSNFDPPLPSHWYSIEGELYRPSADVPPILYLFRIQVPDGHMPGQVPTTVQFGISDAPALVTLSIEDMMKEIKFYFNSRMEISSSLSGGNSGGAALTASAKSSLFDIFRDDIEASFSLRDHPYPLRREKGLPERFAYDKPHNVDNDLRCCRWYPKMYKKLITDDLDVIEGHMAKWNGYIAKLDDLFRNVHNRDFQRLIKHDGLVITPNVPTSRKSLIKIKPLDDMTIDLRFRREIVDYDSDTAGKTISVPGGAFCSLAKGRRVDQDWDENLNCIVDLGKVDAAFWDTVEDKRVYRCYPTASCKFVPREVREQGKHPNGTEHCMEIQYKLIHYFELGDLVDIYKLPPWYAGKGAEAGGGLIAPPSEDPTKADVFKLYEYTQNIYHRVINELTSPIKSISEANLLDIGCGSGGQYHYDLKDWNGSYVGIDIDFAKLHDGQLKFKEGKSRNKEFLPINIAIPWTNKSQNDFFNSRGLWNTYYKSKFAEYLEARHSPMSSTSSEINVFGSAMAAGGGGGGESMSSSPPEGMKFDIVLSIFSSQYSNSTAESWEGYVSEINKRTKSGSSLFLMFMDGDKVDAFSGKCEYLQIPTADRGELLVTASPQGKAEHREPILRSSHVRKSFVESSTDRWEIVVDSPDLRRIIGSFTIPQTHYWKSYIDSISWIILRKI